MRGSSSRCRRRAGARRRRWLGERRQHVGRGSDFGKFLRVGRADIDQRFQRAVGGLPQAEFVGGDGRAPDAGFAGAQLQLAGRARWRRHRHRRRCPPWSGAAPPDRGRGLAAATLPRRDRAASSANATSAAADRDADRRLHSRAPTARCGRTAAARRGLRHSATAAAAACRRPRSSPAVRWRCGYRRCGRTGSSAAARMSEPSSPRVTGWRLPARSGAHRTASR